MTKSPDFIKLCEQLEVHPDRVPEITSFEEACSATGRDPKILPDVSMIPVEHQKRIVADYKLIIIAEALRGCKHIDYTNEDQYKYFPVFEVEANQDKPSGSGLSYFDYDYWLSSTYVGVRLCFTNADLARYFGKQFIDLHKDHQLLT